MDVPDDRQHAKRLVQEIARNYGYLGQEALNGLEHSVKREIETALLLTRDPVVGPAAITLAKNLYTRKARFVFELLQNADDNIFTKALGAGSEPFISFNIHPRHIVLECNEDGFTQENLSAICGIGKSSKSNIPHGYIGEKDIGFKSVFMVAWKVHIQSGPFSFSFIHKKDESGMGLISPIWEETDQVLEAPLTRMTLHLHDPSEVNIPMHAQKPIKAQFDEIQETAFLFLKNLKRIHVSFFDEAGKETSSSTYSTQHEPSTGYTSLKSTRTVNSVTVEECIKYFHVTTHIATDLAKHDNRTYSEAEVASRAYSTSEVVLAFPLSEDSTPIVQAQNPLLIFLPVEPVRFNFLIQADFVTGFSGHNFVIDSNRNVCLFKEIAKAFTKAVLQLCDHPTLRYRWMRYLPRRSAHYTHWERLVYAIENHLSMELVMYGWETTNRHRIRDLRRLPEGYGDENGHPLFDDDELEQIVSPHYEQGDLKILSDYGLSDFSFHHFITGLEKDLKRDIPLSRMKSPRTTDNWHSRVAKLISSAFEDDSSEYTNQILKMDLLPLENGTWVSASSQIYFATSGEIDIPPDIDMQLISKDVRNHDRIELFKKLRVQTAPIFLIRWKVLQKYHELSPNVSHHPSLSTSRSHLEALYKTEGPKEDHAASYKIIALYTHEGKLRQSSSSQPIYANEDGPYSMRELFRKTDPGPNPGDGAPGFCASFINDEYFRDVPEAPSYGHTTWSDWFHCQLGIQKHVTFQDDAGEDSLGAAADYLKIHRPEKFLEALCLWRQDHGHLSESMISRLRETEVLCLGDQIRKAPLKTCYFPTTTAMEYIDTFIKKGAFFPWLAIDGESIGEVIPNKWSDLVTELDIGNPLTSLAFALDILAYSLDFIRQDTVLTIEDAQKVFSLYRHIHIRALEAEDKTEARDRIRLFFLERGSLLTLISEDSCALVHPSDCVWNTHSEAVHRLETKHALQWLYMNSPYIETEDRLLMEAFFTETLGIPACSADTYVDELSELKHLGYTDSKTIQGIYKSLEATWPKYVPWDASEKSSEDNPFQHDAECHNLKNDLEENALIYVPLRDGRAWHKISQCVWSPKAELRGKVCITLDYADLADFFTRILGIQNIDLKMAIDELKEVGSRRSRPQALPHEVEEVKQSIWAVSHLLLDWEKNCPTEWSDFPDSDDIVSTNIFPIRYPDGTIRCESDATDFFLGDREPLRRSFQGKVKFLDFDLEEIWLLDSFIRWTGLGDRFLSTCVTNVTSFDGGEASLITDPNRQVRSRTDALLRVATHFGGSQIRQRSTCTLLYARLKSVEVYETDGLSYLQELVEDEKLYRVIGSKKPTAHFEDDETVVRIYLPRHRDDQAYSFTYLLPQLLFYYMLDVSSVSSVLNSVAEKGIAATRAVLLVPPSQVDRVLEDEGIIDLPVANLEEIERLFPRMKYIEASYNAPSSDNGDSSSGSSGISSSSSNQKSGSPPDDDDDVASDSEVLETSALNKTDPSAGTPGSNQNLSDPPLSHTQSPTPSPTSAVVLVNNSDYLDMMNDAVDTAREHKLELIPSHETFDMGPLQQSLSTLAEQRCPTIIASSQAEREQKINAVGQLYVFEILSSSLPGFSRSNWNSTIRHYVNEHPDYTDLDEWKGQGTSDITYSDDEGVLTTHLVEKGYLDSLEWAGKTPNYFIKVKATISSHETSFSMSPPKHIRMENSIIDSADNMDNVHLIFWVFNLGQREGGIGIEVFLDTGLLESFENLGLTGDKSNIVSSEE